MTLTAWLSMADRINASRGMPACTTCGPMTGGWEMGDDRDASCSSSSRVSIALASVSDWTDGRDNSCTKAADGVDAANGEL